MSLRNSLLATGLALTIPAVALAQKQVSKSADVTTSVTIEAIDHDNRLITLKDKDGEVETVYAGPEVKRFDELKVGQTVVFRYTESVVYQIRPSGAAPATRTADASKVERNEGGKPGATLSQTMTATVTVLAIDPKVPSVKVQTESGSAATFKVEDAANLSSLQVGDKVDITYRAALLIAVE